MENVKVVVVGDGAVGKTCMLYSYIQGQFPGEYIPTIQDNYSKLMQTENGHVQVGLWDTAGQEDYDRLRQLSYPHTKCFVVCYSIVSRASLENVKSKWISEVRHFVPNVPCILVGTKLDLREDTDHRPADAEMVTTADGKAVAEEMECLSFHECSAKTQTNLDTVFKDAVDKGMEFQRPQPPRKRHMCLIL